MVDKEPTKKNFSLKNDRVIKLPKDQNNDLYKQDEDEDEKVGVSIRVPAEYEDIIDEIDKKLKEYKLKKISKQDKWYIGLQLFNTLLDHVDPDAVSKNMNIQKYLEFLIESKMKE